MYKYCTKGGKYMGKFNSTFYNIEEDKNLDNYEDAFKISKNKETSYVYIYEHEKFESLNQIKIRNENFNIEKKLLQNYKTQIEVLKKTENYKYETTIITQREGNLNSLKDDDKIRTLFLEQSKGRILNQDGDTKGLNETSLKNSKLDIYNLNDKKKEEKIKSPFLDQNRDKILKNDDIKLFEALESKKDKVLYTDLKINKEASLNNKPILNQKNIDKASSTFLEQNKGGILTSGDIKSLKFRDSFKFDEPSALKESKAENVNLSQKNQSFSTSEENIKTVKKLVKLKLYREALNICESMLKANKEDVELYLYLGIINYSIGNYNEALKYYNLGINYDNNNYKLYNNRGTTYIELNQHIFAVLDFTKAIKLMPETSILYENRARAYYKIEMYEESLTDINTAMKFDKSDKLSFLKGQILCKLGKYDSALNEYNSLLRAGKSDRQLLLSIADAYYFKNDYENAFLNVRKVIDLNPRDYNAYYKLGNIHFDMKEYSNAIGDYSKSLEINNSYYPCYLKLGLVYFNIDEYKKCIQSLDDAEKYGCKDIELYSNRGEAFLALGKFNEAIRDFNIAIDIDPNAFGIYFDRGVAYSNLNEYAKSYSDLIYSRRLMEKYNDSGKYDKVILTIDNMISELDKVMEHKEIV